MRTHGATALAAQRPASRRPRYGEGPKHVGFARAPPQPARKNQRPTDRERVAAGIAGKQGRDDITIDAKGNVVANANAGGKKNGRSQSPVLAEENFDLAKGGISSAKKYVV